MERNLKVKRREKKTKLRNGGWHKGGAGQKKGGSWRMDAKAHTPAGWEWVLHCSKKAFFSQNIVVRLSKRQYCV